MSEISVEALELLLKVDSAVEHHDIGLMGEARYLDAKERLHDFIATLEFNIASLESKLADAQARLAGYEVGFDPKVKLPEPLTIEWRGYPVFVVIDVNGYTHICDAYSKEYGFRATQGERVQFYSVDKVLRWFPLPDAKEDE